MNLDTILTFMDRHFYGVWSGLSAAVAICAAIDGYYIFAFAGVVLAIIFGVMYRNASKIASMQGQVL